VPRPLGQHFLVRPAILERIAAATGAGPESLVVEIGAAQGQLTAHLLRHAGRVVAIEIDARLADRLRERFSQEPRLTIVQADVLALDLCRWGPAIVAGNLPYYITSPLVERILACHRILERAVLLVQKEVAERLNAAAGTREYGFLTVQTQLFASVEYLWTVPRSAFAPPPKVTSAVVRLTPRAAPGVPDPRRFLEFASFCFRHKRKTLRNNLIAMFGKEAVDRLPETRLRAEQLSLARLQELYAALASSAGSPQTAG
jgi:16S rRNA (adenine1518-N6/adenine1519-N6)-dimethyltransferase